MQAAKTQTPVSISIPIPIFDPVHLLTIASLGFLHAARTNRQPIGAIRLAHERLAHHEPSLIWGPGLRALAVVELASQLQELPVVLVLVDGDDIPCVEFSEL